MEVLKQEILRKKQSLKEDTGGRKFFKRSELEQKQIQKLRDQEKLELQAKSNRQSQSSSSSSTTTTTANTSSTTAAAATTSSLTDEQNVDKLVLPRQEVIRRLRFLKQPITLFGEDDTARLDRLKYVLKNGLFEVDSDMTTEGQTNDFLRDIMELRKRRRSGTMMMSERKRQKGEEDKDGGGVDNDKDLKRMKANFDELCEEDKILVFFKRLLTERRQELDEMGEAEKRTAKGKSMVATFKQCARYLNPLFKFCRKKVSGFWMNFQAWILFGSNSCYC